MLHYCNGNGLEDLPRRKHVLGVDTANWRDSTPISFEVIPLPSTDATFLELQKFTTDEVMNYFNPSLPARVPGR